MIEIRVCKAGKTGPKKVEASVIVISNDIPDLRPIVVGENYRDIYQAFFSDQADQIMVALRSLPQGTLHQLLIKLLQNQENFFSVTGIYAPPVEEDK